VRKRQKFICNKSTLTSLARRIMKTSSDSAPGLWIILCEECCWRSYRQRIRTKYNNSDRKSEFKTLSDTYKPIHFLDQPIEVLFDITPAREKTPDCPNGFIWEDKTYRVVEMLSSWSDFKRRGKMARNMRPEHAAVAATRGSLNVGRFYFRVRVETNQIFDIYYDRAMKNVDDRKGQWFIYRELGEE
jgi:hypothetical protein